MPPTLLQQMAFFMIVNLCSSDMHSIALYIRPHTFLYKGLLLWAYVIA